MPGFGVTPFERPVGLLGPAAESSVSVSTTALRWRYGCLVAFSANGPVDFGVATGGQLVMVGKRKYLARLIMVNDRPSAALLLDHSRYLLKVALCSKCLAPFLKSSC